MRDIAPHGTRIDPAAFFVDVIAVAVDMIHNAVVGSVVAVVSEIPITIVTVVADDRVVDDGCRLIIVDDD